jgi:[histone H3]-trimethyl-L-lysine9/36 demethylase
MGGQGFYQQDNTTLPPMNLKEFENMAKVECCKPPKHSSVDDLERKYWKNVTFGRPIYGADVSGTLFDKEQNIWNPSRLETILDCVCEDYDVKVFIDSFLY